MIMVISQKKLAANRRNSIKGGEAFKKKLDDAYAINPTICKNCGEILPRTKKNNTFCSRSCSAQSNNAGVRRHGNPKTSCIICNNETNSSRAKYCSKQCMGIGYTTNKSAEEIRANKAEISANYRARLQNQTPEDVDREAIREFYMNRPAGYEVDHIIPISKGGLHALENLQYLTITENRRKSNKLPL